MMNMLLGDLKLVREVGKLQMSFLGSVKDFKYELPTFFSLFSKYLIDVIIILFGSFLQLFCFTFSQERLQYEKIFKYIFI